MPATTTPVEFAFVPHGASFARTYESIVDESGLPVTNLAGWTFAGAIKTTIADTDGGALVSIADGSFSKLAGKAGFILPPATMAVLTIGIEYFFAVKASSPSGFVDTIDELRLQITKSARQSI